MRCFFESVNNVIIPFSRVERVREGKHHTGETVVMVWTDGDGEAGYWPCESIQLEEYKQWLRFNQASNEESYRSLLLNNQLLQNMLSSSERPNKLTKEQVSKIVRMGYEPECTNCEISAKDDDDCQCRRDFIATDKFIDKVNNEILTAENTEGTEKTNYSEIQTSSQE